MRQVVWSKEARDDYFEILHYIAEDDPDAAERVVRAIRKTDDGLANFATGHPGRVAGTYEKSVLRLPYIVVYSFSEDGAALIFLRVIHTARHWAPDDWPA
ncbi:type II toxin-antitoxin system RelE/ParE family toxin [Novosphingobium sp.]|uniref:type II toxin-antitoxin system RelE/ParE family toxin n=1 Tax=Novosphingobium sp. TaxID=1874826 RepID=UPI0026161CD2|nr:type II toxin-antitoxin system RelE/ParE family toxin [Novosphingobium sp.]